MKKIVFILCASVAIVFASCTGCHCNRGHVDQDTVVVNDTVVVEEFDTVHAE